MAYRGQYLNSYMGRVPHRTEVVRKKKKKEDWRNKHDSDLAQPLPHRRAPRRRVRRGKIGVFAGGVEMWSLDRVGFNGAIVWCTESDTVDRFTSWAKGICLIAHL